MVGVELFYNGHPVVNSIVDTIEPPLFNVGYNPFTVSNVVILNCNRQIRSFCQYIQLQTMANITGPIALNSDLLGYRTSEHFEICNP